MKKPTIFLDKEIKELSALNWGNFNPTDSEIKYWAELRVKYAKHEIFRKFMIFLATFCSFWLAVGIGVLLFYANY